MDHVTIREATQKDFDNVYTLILNEHNNTNIIKKDDWNQLFKKHWGNTDELLGYVLIDKVREGK